MSSCTNVTISFVGNLRHRLGCREQLLEFDEPTVTIRSVFERLIEINGEELRDWLINDYGWVDSRCIIFVDGEHLNSATGIDHDITGSDRVQLTLAHPMTGG